MSTSAGLNTSNDPGYRELCDVLKELVQCQTYFDRRKIKKQKELISRSKILLNQGAKVNNHSIKNCDTPLHYAVEFGDTEIINILLLKGADVNAKNRMLETPLHLAMRKKATNTIQLLLKKGADLNIVNHDGSTPFHFSLKFCDESIINFLLENKLDIVITENFRKEYLKLAIAGNFLKVVHFILDNSVEVKEQDKTDSTILCEAIKKGNIEIFQLLLEKVFNVNSASEMGPVEPLLRIAIENHSEDIAKLLIADNADVNSKDEDDTSMLLLATRNECSADLVKLLLENGANLKDKDKFGMMPINYAVEFDLELVDLLLDKNSDLNDKDNKLAFCLCFLHYDECSLLENSYRNLNVKSYDSDDFPGSDYSFSGDSDVESDTTEVEMESAEKLFVERGFTISYEDFNDVHIPKDFSSYVEDIFEVKENRSSVADILRQKEAVDPEEFGKSLLMYKVLKGSIQSGFIGIVQNLLSPSVNLNAYSISGYTLFHDAVIYRHLPIVEVLLRHGADVNAVHKVNKMSALHLAVLNEDLDMMTFLLKNNAYIDARDDRNQTPLFLAVRKKYYEIILLLLNAGANSNLVDVKKRSPLFLAIHKDSARLIRILLHYGACINASNMRKIIELCKEHVNYLVSRRFVSDILFEHDAFSFNLNSTYFLNIRSQKFLDHGLRVKYATFNETNLDMLRDSNTHDFQIECLEEINRMKLMRIEGYNLSIHDVLIKSKNQIATYLRNENMVQILESIDLKKKFPIFGSKLKVHLEKGKVEVQLLKVAHHCLDIILKVKLPSIVIHKILSHFVHKELLWLIFVSPIDNALKTSVQCSESLIPRRDS